MPKKRIAVVKLLPTTVNPKPQEVTIVIELRVTTDRSPYEYAEGLAAFLADEINTQNPADWPKATATGDVR